MEKNCSKVIFSDVSYTETKDDVKSFSIEI